MDTTTSKGFFESKGIWGSIVTLAPVLGFALEKLGVVPVGTVNELTALITSLAGGLLSMYGRIKATSSIKGI